MAVAKQDARQLPKVLSQRVARELLEADGWAETLGGKHNVKMEKPGHRPIVLPHHHGGDYPPGLRSAILREAGLSGPSVAAVSEGDGETSD